MSVAPIVAQDDVSLRQLLTQAEQDYRVGRLEQAISVLTTKENEFQGNLKQSAYRLIALCYLEQDQWGKAENYAQLLLNENPYYSSVQDPVRFEEMIKRLKSGQLTTVTTASSQAETLEETPVPVTVITAEMIETLGYNKNLNQILAAYVPGMNEVASPNLDNISMRGAYTSGQEKILVMENGHRLNARSTNNGHMDYSISTEKIDHIEVLRGPASSLYGNVALTAVVNIITRKGGSVDGLEAKYGYGTFATHKADLLMGSRFMNADVTAWGSFFSSDGHHRFVPAMTPYSFSPYDGHAQVDMYNGKPSYDAGFTLQYKDFNLMASHKHSKKTQQYAFYGETYDYGRYRKFDGLKPGYSIEETHAELGYSHTFGHLTLNASVYGDWYDFVDYGIISDSIFFVDFNNDGSVKINEDGEPVMKNWHGFYQVYDWKENTIGGTAQLSTNYKAGRMKGNLLAGAQYEHFTLSDTYGVLGADYDSIAIFTRESLNTIKTGREQSLSFYVQDKHYFTPKLIINGGLRYDIKYRANNTHVTALSPRLALIYILSQQFSAKVSYSRAFVDAPYFYRFNTDNTYMGSENLMPEYMNSVQLDLMGSIKPWHLTYDLNLFYNKCTNMIYNIPNAGLEDIKYRNSGQLENMGIEASLHYAYRNLSADLTLYADKPFSATDYYYSDDKNKVYFVPSTTACLHLAWKPLQTDIHTLKLYGTAKYSGSKLIPGGNAISEGDYYISDNVIADLGMKYSFRNHLHFSLDCTNLFNDDNCICGAIITIFPQYQRGRMLMGIISYTL